MKEEVGDRNFPVWLLGDSEPEHWRDKLETPFDPRHPIRHNIWSSVLDVIQEKIFLDTGKRFNSSAVYIRNAVQDVKDKPAGNKVDWLAPVNAQIDAYSAIVAGSTPRVILSFGSFSYEFARRACHRGSQYNYRYWNTKRLGKEFIKNIEDNSGAVVILPLLHRSIAGGRFLSSHKAYCNSEEGNYFEYVGQKIADRLMTFPDKPDIWLRPYRNGRDQEGHRDREED